MRTIVLFGATGYSGTNIAAELVRRGHRVIGVARDVTNAPGQLEAVAGTIHDRALVQRLAEGADDLVVALPARAPEAGAPRLIDALPALVEAAERNGARLSFVGGAGSLRVSEDGPALLDTPDFPADYREEGEAHRAVLEELRDAGDTLDWFYVSPAATYGAWNAGERRGTYRIGGEVLLVDDDGQSAISGVDFATAYVDELETGAHPRSRFGVAY